ncbi:MAG: hypothetical protein EZS28_052778 [Streblomastix strix]|uniref:Uncharacterized protein n=1 Tax=Streblomastix strix TaxID=222440 RepID=A0A5J4RWI9_9EUKA|nr:MAG: hypothetical protein EZS28_052778 [Streblomastix strix]
MSINTVSSVFDAVDEVTAEQKVFIMIKDVENQFDYNNLQFMTMTWRVERREMFVKEFWLSILLKESLVPLLQVFNKLLLVLMLSSRVQYVAIPGESVFYIVGDNVQSAGVAAFIINCLSASSRLNVSFESLLDSQDS